jgi:hypothetical protein
LVSTSEPPGRVTAGTGFGLVVAVEDAYGNVNPYSGASVLVALQAPPGGGPLAGPQTALSNQGLATLSGLTLDEAAGGYVLEVSSAGLNAAHTTAVNVAAAKATKLVITQQARSVNAGAGFGLTVVAEDVYGNVDPSYSGNVSLALPEGTTGQSLTGMTTMGAVSGVAVFAGLALQRGGSISLVVWATRRIKQKTTLVLKPVAIRVSYNPSNDSATLELVGHPKFAMGGRITIVNTPLNGVSSSANVPLAASSTVFTILAKASGITPG